VPDLAVVERELCRIPEVRAARIVADDEGNPVEVHVLAAPGKTPKQVVRDVQSVALAANGLDLDHRIVSVVQLDDTNGTAPVPAADQDGDGLPDQPAPDRPLRERASADRQPGERTVLETVLVRRRGVRASAEVVLRLGTASASGEAEGSAASVATHRLVADATLDALRGLEPAAGRAAVETAVVVHLGDRDVALATLVLLVPPNEEVVCGAAPVRAAGPDEALARAVLDAANRRLPALR